MNIPASGGHQMQAAMQADYRIGVAIGTYIYYFEANIVYIFCEANDVPNWGSGITGSVSTPCSNWNAKIYTVEPIAERSQTGGMRTAISGNRSKSSALRAAVALPCETSLGLLACISGDRTVTCAPKAAIQGETGIDCRLRASIQSDVEASNALYAAVAKEFGTTLELRAVVGKDFINYLWVKAAIQGETGTSCGLKAYVLQSRKNIIRIEFEPCLPQDFAQISVPNWPSTYFDSREEQV